MSTSTVEQDTPAQDLDKEVFALVTSLVTLAKEHQIKTLQSLRDHANRIFPGKSEKIEEAIALWAKYEQSKPYSAERFRRY